MKKFRTNVNELGSFPVNSCTDYLPGIDGLPKSDVLKFHLSCGSVVIRPSGTEPKLKAYISVLDESSEAAKEKEKKIADCLRELVN